MNNWNAIVIGFNSLLGILIFFRMWHYIRREMKTAPTYTKFDKIKNLIASFIFSLLSTLTILFVVAFISSTIAINALYALEGSEQVNEKMIEAWQFPTFLPAVLIIITAFAFVYPLYEYLMLASPERQANMEIQDFVERKIIQRFPAPFSYFVALLLFLLLVIAIPVAISYYMIKYANIIQVSRVALTAKWVLGLIFFSWLMLGPMIYLAFYSKIGTAHILFRAAKINLHKDKKTAIYLIIAIISIITTIYSFFKYVPILWGKFPKTSTDYYDLGSGAFKDLLLPFIPESQIETFQKFTAIVPIDFILFIFTTVIIAFIGFYIKFLKKEPLNRPSIVLFATYIFIGTAYTILLNAMIKWPWVFPDQRLEQFGLYLDFQNPTHQQIIVRLFSTTILIEKTVNLGFLIYFLFFNKEIRKNADEWILNNAIIKNDMEVVSRYTQNVNIEIKKMALQSLISYIKIKDSLNENESKNFAAIMGPLLIEKEPTINRLVNENISELLKKLHVEHIIEVLEDILSDKEEENFQQALLIIKNLAKIDVNKILDVLEGLYLRDLNEAQYNQLLKITSEISNSTKDFIITLFLRVIDKHDLKESVLERFLQLLEIHLNRYVENRSKISELVDILIQYLKTLNSGLLDKVISLYASIVSIKKEYLDQFIEDIKSVPNLSKKGPIVKRSKIGALTRVINAYPDRFWDIFPIIENIFNPHKDKEQWTYSSTLISHPNKLEQELDKHREERIRNILFQQQDLKDGQLTEKTENISESTIPEKTSSDESPEDELKVDFILALGSIAVNLDEDTFIDALFPYFIQFIMEPSDDVKIATLKSIALISASREDIYDNPAFQLIIGKMLIDPLSEIRHEIYRIIQRKSLNQLIIYITEYLSHDLDTLIRLELLNLLTNNAERIGEFPQKYDLLQILFDQDFGEYRKNEDNTTRTGTNYSHEDEDSSNKTLIAYINRYKVDIEEFYREIGEEYSIFRVEFDDQIPLKENLQAIGDISVLDATLSLIFEWSKDDPEIRNKAGDFIKEKMFEAFNGDDSGGWKKNNGTSMDNGDNLPHLLPVPPNYSVVGSLGNLPRIKMIDYMAYLTIEYYKTHSEGERFEDYFDEIDGTIQKYIGSDNALIRKEITRFYAKVLNHANQFHKRIIKGFIAIIDAYPLEILSPRVISYYLKSLGKMIFHYPDFYLTPNPEISKNIESKSRNAPDTKRSLYDTYAIPIIEKLLNTHNELIWSSIVQFFNMVFQIEDKRFSEATEQIVGFKRLLGEQTYYEKIRNSLLKIFGETQLSLVKIRVLRLLVNSPFEMKNEQIIKILLDHLKADDPELKATVINTLGRILLLYKPFKNQDTRKRTKEYKTFRKLLLAAINYSYKPSEDRRVRYEIVKVTSQLSEHHPFNPIITQTLRMIAADPDTEIAGIAMDSYFRILFSTTIESRRNQLIEYIHDFTAIEDPELNAKLIQYILTLYEQGVKIKVLLPPLMQLASSPNSEVRMKVFSIFEKFYDQNPDDFLFLIDIILKLLKSRDLAIKRDAARALYEFIFKKPEKVKNNKIIFRSFRILAKDDDLEIKIIVSSYLDRLIESFPEFYKEILEIIFIFIRTGINEVMQNVVGAVKLLILQHPEIKDDVVDSLKRYYKKNQDGMLYALLSEIE